MKERKREREKERQKNLSCSSLTQLYINYWTCTTNAVYMYFNIVRID